MQQIWCCLFWEGLSLQRDQISRAYWQIASDDCICQWTMCLSANNLLFPLVREIKNYIHKSSRESQPETKMPGYNLLFIWLIREHNTLQSDNTCFATFVLPVSPVLLVLLFGDNKCFNVKMLKQPYKMQKRHCFLYIFLSA